MNVEGINDFKKGTAITNPVFGNGIITRIDPNNQWCSVDFYDEETGTITSKDVLFESLTLIPSSAVRFPDWALCDPRYGDQRFWRLRKADSPRGPFSSELPFKGIGHIEKSYALKALEYAYNFVFRNPLHWTVSQPMELFCNTFLGKLGHCAVYQYLTSRKAPNGEPYTVTGFDAFCGFTINKYQDLTVNCKKVLIKATKSRGQLLLLSKSDWSKSGIYQKNKERYSFIFLARIENDPETILKSKGLYNLAFASYEEILDAFSGLFFTYDIPGFITCHDLAYLMEQRFGVHKGNGFGDIFKVNEESWYCQCNDLRKPAFFKP